MDRRTILVTGSTGNIGGGAALALARRGANIVLLGRRMESLERKVEAVRSLLPTGRGESGVIGVLTIDFSDMESVRRAASEALSRYPQIDGIVLSAVTLVQGGPTILPNGHEIMFATNVMGPFLFAELLAERMQRSEGLVLHVIAPFHQRIDWDDLESIRTHNTNIAYERSKTMHRAIAGEMARRYAGRLSSVAFDPTFIIDRTDPELAKRWPKGFMGFFWSVMTALLAKPPATAGEPIADIMLSSPDANALNGALFELDRRKNKPDKDMSDTELGRRLWEELSNLTAQGAVNRVGASP